MPYIQSLMLATITISIPDWLYSGHTLVGMAIGLVVGLLIGRRIG